jgi:hypothetical protein
VHGPTSPGPAASTRSAVTYCARRGVAGPGCLNEVGGKGWGGRVRVGYRARHDVAGPGCLNPTHWPTTTAACESASEPTAISSPPDQFEQRLNLNYLR